MGEGFPAGTEPAPLQVREFGAGPAVLLLHGMPSSSEDLLPLAQALASRYRVLLADLPGYAGSAPLADPSIPAVQHCIEHALLQRQVERVAIVGFSGGAYRAFHLALSGRVRVAAIAALGATPGVESDAAAPLRQMAAALRAGIDLRAVAVAQFLSPRSQSNAAAVRAVQGWASAAPAAVVAAELESCIDAGSLATQLPALHCPLLLRVGLLDQATPPRLSEAIARLVPGAQLERVADSGHALLIEDPDASVASVQEFLRRHY